MLKLLDFIKQNKNWEELLSKSPYSLSIKQNEFYIKFNYNQIESDFSNPIVQEARGIILRKKDLKPVAIPFFKFFNYGEGNAAKIDWNTARALEKIDGCCDEETVLETDIGEITIKEICDKKIKCKVKAFDFINNKEIFTNVIDYSIKENNDDWYEIELENGIKIKLTGNHKVWITNLNCYRCVKDLNKDDDVMLTLS